MASLSPNGYIQIVPFVSRLLAIILCRSYNGNFILRDSKLPRFVLQVLGNIRRLFCATRIITLLQSQTQHYHRSVGTCRSSQASAQELISFSAVKTEYAAFSLQYRQIMKVFTMYDSTCSLC